MKTTLLKKLMMVIAFFATITMSAQATYTFSTGLEGWALAYGQPGSTSGTVTHDATGGETGDGALVLDRESNNSNIGLNPAGIDATVVNYVRIKYKNLSNATSFRFQGSSTAGTLSQKVFNIDAATDAWVTNYLFVGDITNWSGTVDNLDILVRAGFVDTTEGNMIVDEIEFLNYQDEFSEFIKNPSFDDLSGIAHITGNEAFASRALTTAVFKDGTQSLLSTYSADADNNYWAFTAYEKVYTTAYTAGTEIQVKMWVKTNRTTPIAMAVRVKTTIGGVDTPVKPIANVTTTDTAMEWEELTFDLVSPDAFDGVTFWFNIAWADETAGAVPENLKSGDLVYIDQMTATILDGTLSVQDNVLEGVKVYPNPTSDILNVSSPAGTNLNVYNVLGVLVKSETGVQENHSMNVSNLSSGLYFLKMESEGKVATKKFQVN